MIGRVDINDFSGLSVALTDNGGVTGQSRHPLSHRPTPHTVAVDFATTNDSAVGTKDQGGRTRGIDPATGNPANKFDAGAVELQKGEM
jgi:hypothetical protein